MIDHFQTFEPEACIPFEDGRGLYPDRIQAAAPIGLRSQVHRVAASLGMTSAAFIREAIHARLRSAGNSLKGA